MLLLLRKPLTLVELETRLTNGDCWVLGKRPL